MNIEPGRINSWRARQEHSKDANGYEQKTWENETFIFMGAESLFLISEEWLLHL